MKRTRCFYPRKGVVVLFLVGLAGLLKSCQPAPPAPPAWAPSHLGQLTAQLTDVMVHDVTNPPLAARFFAYAYLAGYEVVAQYDSTQPSLAGALNGYPAFTPPEELRGGASSMSAVLAVLETAQRLQPSGHLIAAYETHLLDSCRRAGVPDESLQRARAYAGAVSQHVLRYARQDRYNRISNYPRYTPRAEAGHWYPTPPGYFAAVEPYFHTVRPLTLDTCHQFQPPPPVPFSKERRSAFFTMLTENYQHQLSDDEREIAAFWDCNPFALSDNGHLQLGLKKISPGAHWMGITGLACQQAGVSFERALRIHTVVAAALLDGFIGCWDEKYRSQRIRPETAIRQFIDPAWKPFLQTPPFPEYLSGHSVISAAAAEVLTRYLGDAFAYTDTVEVRFGLKPRRFASFRQAADEAGQSRFYGGIHFRDAIVNGQRQGEQIGRWVLGRVEGNRTGTAVAATH